jgi:CPA2 family monovalent cation:H+ antiporter-2
MVFPILFDIGLIIFVSAMLAYVSRFLRQPIILAYVAAGVIIGPFGFGLITNVEEINLLAELGIVFLLFSVGLEIDFRKFKNVGIAALSGGVMQILVTFLMGFSVAMLFGLGNIIGIYLGLLLAFSSTMIVTKILVDKDELNTLHGRMMLGILLLQDIVAIVVLPILSNISNLVSIEFVGSIVLKGIGLFAIAILLNKFFFPRVLDYAAQRHEIFFLTAIANCFFFIGASYVLGFSIAIGGFIAGLSMANFPYNIEIAGETHALRDFFSIIFFSTLGMQLNVWIIQSSFVLFFSLLLLTLIAKPIIFAFLYLFMGYGGRTSNNIGLGLGQASEFMFIIAAEEFMLGNISSDFYSLLISIVVVSIIITPYWIRGRNTVYRFFSKIRIPHPHIRHLIHPRSIYELENPPERELKNHIIIFGAHRMGQRVAEYLQHRGEKFIVIERDPEIVRNLGRKGIYCIYGDAENDEILKKSSLDKAKLLILTIPFADTASFVVRKAKRFDEKIKILARAHSEIDAERLYKAGADVVIIPEFVSAEKIIKKIDHFLREREL